MGQFATKLDAEKEKKNQKEQKESKKVLLSKADKFKNHHANGKIDLMQFSDVEKNVETFRGSCLQY